MAEGDAFEETDFVSTDFEVDSGTSAVPVLDEGMVNGGLMALSGGLA